MLARAMVGARSTSPGMEDWSIVALLFIFDMDDVLYRYDWRARMARMTELTGHDLLELRRRWWHLDGEFAAEAGGFADADAYFEAHCMALGCTVDRDDWLDARGGAMTAIPGSLEAVRRASELGRVTLLTNNNPLVESELPRLAPDLVPLFGESHLFASSSYGARKPDAAVYRAAMSAYGAAAEDTFFADDRPENVEGAEALGITAHLFTGPEGLIDAIERFAASRA